MNFHDLTMKDIQGEDVSFDTFKGKHCLVVNVASECGMTPQYKGLEDLYRANQEKNFTVLGFPCNQFKEQEPGSDAEICEFVQSKYQVTFPMFSKIKVNGENACQLYQWLKSETATGDEVQDIPWNFAKFLVDGEGRVVERFGPRTTPAEIAAKLADLV